MDTEETLECIRDFNGAITVGQLLKVGMKLDFDNYQELTLELSKYFTKG